MSKKLNFLDSFLGFISPSLGFRRAQARRAFDLVRSYDGASSSRRTGGWVTSGASPNVETQGALEKIRNRVRDLVRNNSYAARAVSVIETNVIGTGITCGINAKNKAIKEQVAALWAQWADNLICDNAGVNNFYGLQAMAFRSCVESGESIAVRRWRKGQEIPLQIQILEGDFIDHSKNETLSDGNYIIQGIEFNKEGKRVAYWLWNQHPGEQFGMVRNSLKSERHEAKNVKHFFRPDRPGQVRGMSWGASTVIKLADLDAYEDAQLLRQRLASCFAGFVRDMETPADAIAAEDAFPEKVEAGAIEILPPGKTIEFPQVPTVSNDGHTERVLRNIAMGWGITYESLTGDLSNVNFSSGRMGWLEFQRNIEKWQWLLFIPQFCEPIFQWFLESIEISKGVRTDGVYATWTPPRRQMIDPTREIPATISAIRGGIQTLPEAVREQGWEFEKHMAEVKASNDLIDKLELILDCDPRKVQKSGGVQQLSLLEPVQA